MEEYGKVKNVRKKNLIDMDSNNRELYVSQVKKKLQHSHKRNKLI